MRLLKAVAIFVTARTALEAVLAVPLSIVFTGLALAGLFTEPALLCPAIPVGVLALSLVNALGRRWRMAQALAESNDLSALSEDTRHLP